MTPLVSICLPNLNTYRFLKERIQTIYDQSLHDWELVVVDSFSDDGSWELFLELARQDSRVSIAQAPRGLYSSWNECVRKARGKYIYIATSDDTMAPNCLQSMVTALEENDDCDLAHCPLRIIDETGAQLHDPAWPACTAFIDGLPELIGRSHIRRAPYDGLLHLSGDMVYMSVTQLLIRRSLFSKIGGFETRWGSMGDRHWEMKAGLVANTIHVPQTWASWRLTTQQASSAIDVFSEGHSQKIEEMIEDAVVKCAPSLAPSVLDGLESRMKSSRELRLYYSDLRILKNPNVRRIYQARQLAAGRRAAWMELLRWLQGRPKWTRRAAGEIREWLEALGLQPILT
jgi:hypothetical protein